jgi:hypothetical protein
MMRAQPIRAVALARATFPVWQRLGFHVSADHFYDSIPNTSLVKEAHQPGRRDLPSLAVDWDVFVPAGASRAGR